MKPKFNIARSGVLGIAALVLLSSTRAAQAGWAEEALKSEADYIVNCSFTTQAKNHEQVQPGDAAYGALNNVRLAGGPDWVRPGEGAMALIGLMAATMQLKQSGYPVEKYNAVIDAFFQNWLLKNRDAFCMNAASPNYGGVASQVIYNSDGSLKTPPTGFNTGATGAMLCAMWKYYEFNKATGRSAIADQWLRGDAYDIALRGGQFIKKCHNAKYDLVSPSPSGGNLWINDAALSTAGLRCLAKWAQVSGKSGVLDEAGTTPTQLADTLASGLERMKDSGGWKGFYKFLNPADGSRSYDGSLDQLCFVPYETDALDPSQDFAKAISDFWTNGADGRRMTYQTDDPKRWTYFGTRWHYYDTDNPETDRLTPGAGLQLAKVEWKYFHARNDATLRERAMKRFQFANSTAYSNLWLGADDRSEAGVSGGIVDWRHAAERDNTGEGKPRRADEWERFIDTSAYFIEVTLMTFWNKDTKYTPQ
jgi:hypothetical protein